MNPLGLVRHDWRYEYYKELQPDDPRKELNIQSIIANIKTRIQSSVFEGRSINTIHKKKYNNGSTVRCHVNIKSSDKFITSWTEFTATQQLDRNLLPTVYVEGVRGSTATTPIVHLVSKAEVNRVYDKKIYQHVKRHPRNMGLYEKKSFGTKISIPGSSPTTIYVSKITISGIRPLQVSKIELDTKSSSTSSSTTSSTSSTIKIPKVQYVRILIRSESRKQTQHDVRLLDQLFDASFVSTTLPSLLARASTHFHSIGQSFSILNHADDWGNIETNPSPQVFYMLAQPPDILSRKNLPISINDAMVSLPQIVHQYCREMGDTLLGAIFSTYGFHVEHFVRNYMEVLSNVPVVILHGDQKVQPANVYKKSQNETRPKSIHRKFPEWANATLAQPTASPRRLYGKTALQFVYFSLFRDAIGKDLNANDDNDVEHESDKCKHWETFDLPENIEIINMHTPTNRFRQGVHHSKFVLLFGKDKIRVIVTTDNVTRSSCMNTFWTQEFPTNPQKETEMKQNKEQKKVNENEHHKDNQEDEVMEDKVMEDEVMEDEVDIEEDAEAIFHLQKLYKLYENDFDRLSQDLTEQFNIMQQQSNAIKQPPLLTALSAASVTTESILSSSSSSSSTKSPIILPTTSPSLLPTCPKRRFGATLTEYLNEIDRTRDNQLNRHPRYVEDFLKRILSPHSKYTVTIENSLNKYDFTSSCVALTTSVPIQIEPAVNHNPKKAVTGSLQLKDWLARHNEIFSPTSKLGNLIMQPTSMGSYISTKVFSFWMNCFSGKTIEEINNLKKDDLSSTNPDQVSILWPTKNYFSMCARIHMTLSNGGKSTGSIFFPADAYTGMKLLHKHFCKYVPSRKDLGEIIPMHNKSYIRLYEDMYHYIPKLLPVSSSSSSSSSSVLTSSISSASAVSSSSSSSSTITNMSEWHQRARWLETSSACFSIGAQGAIETDIVDDGGTCGTQGATAGMYIVRNFEMGVLFLDSPNTILLCGTKPNIETIDDNGTNGTGPKTILTFPIPYEIPAPTYMKDGDHGIWNEEPYLTDKIEGTILEKLNCWSNVEDEIASNDPMVMEVDEVSKVEKEVKEEKDDVSIKSKSMLTSSLSENKKRTSDDFLGEQNNTRSQNISKRPRQVK